MMNYADKGQWRRALIYFLWLAPEQTGEQSIETPVIWDTIALWWRHCNETSTAALQISSLCPYRLMVISSKFKLEYVMTTSSNGNISALLAICAGNSPVTCEFPAQRPVTRSFDVFFCAWINGWVKNREAGDLRCHRAHYDVTVMWLINLPILHINMYNKNLISRVVIWAHWTFIPRNDSWSLLKCMPKQIIIIMFYLCFMINISLTKHKMYLQFISFLHIDMPHAVQILPRIRQRLTYCK